MKIQDVSNIWYKIRKFRSRSEARGSADENQFAFLEYVTYLVQELTGAEGGRFYVLSDINNDSSRQELVLKIFHHKMTDTTRTITFNKTDQQRTNNIPLRNHDGGPNEKNPAALAALENKPVNVTDIRLSKEFDFTDIFESDQFLNYETRSLLTIPICNHHNEVNGILQIFNATTRLQDEEDTGILNEADILEMGTGKGKYRAFNDEDISHTEMVAAIMGITISNYQLTADMEKLFESFVKVLANAIDEKSAYTGHHCRRVPILAKMLAEALVTTHDGPFRDFKMSDNDKYQLELASLLHDCGKITTPAHIMDKSTKLETVFDRIELINTRFEIILRDLEISYLREKHKTAPDQQEVLRNKFQAIVDDCKRDRRFLRECNIGREEMQVQMKERVYQIAKRYKYRNSKGEIVSCLTDNEVENLCVTRGTLTKQERDAINYHATTTLHMLEKMHFPRHLRRIPEIAVNHHERMDGTGYPRGLKREQMSVEARLMGVVDVFEALTAKDRPYKRGKTLSEALKIMGRMRQDNHIDSDIFDVFIDKKVYLEYAKKHLDDYQIDDVKVEEIPGYHTTSSRNERAALDRKKKAA